MGTRRITIGIAAMLMFGALGLMASGTLQAQSKRASTSAHSGGSLLVERHRVAIKRGPSGKYKLRGMAVKGSRLPIYESKEGDGCSGDVWYRVYEEGWVCGNGVTLIEDAPAAIEQPPMENDAVTPWPYAFIKETAIEYQWSSHGWVEETREIFKGFGFGVEKRVSIDGEKYFKTPEGKLIPTYAARVSGRVSTFQGVPVSRDQQWPVGWVNSQEAWAYQEPAEQKEQRVRKLSRYDFFAVQGQVDVKKKHFYQLSDGLWVSGKDVRVTTNATRPEGIADDERWIDVDVNQQIVTAYVGDEPVYATMVSTGRYGASKTVRGQFRIWVKVAAIAMDNTDEEEELDSDSEVIEPTEERKLYSLQDVPWTQFFHENYALHAVYWHNKFGNRKSHGCVNMAPADAEWFYRWTAPSVPAGWWSVYSTANDKGTMVRVR
ncbi:MAG: L,D-transpeptidase [Deltaproteobacteria bacterium]|nr:L,D-transpeptidase [Deltaproteobacteria bacterium]MBN2673349.1 L,D-transpeptidase [Deltaproteobacteria bacterium]